MKRLLAYLIVVISLGLTFNVNAETDKNGKQISYCKQINNYDWYGIVSGQNCNDRYPNKISSTLWIKEQLDRYIKLLDDPNNNKNRKTKIINFLNSMDAKLNSLEIDNSIIDDVISQYPQIDSIYSKQKTFAKKDTFKDNFKVEKTIKKQISFIYCKNSVLNLDNFKECPYWAGKQITYNEWVSDSVKSKNVCIKDIGTDRWAMLTNHSCDFFNTYEAKYNGTNFDYNYPIKKIAKAEPSQTQKVAKGTNTKQDNDYILEACLHKKNYSTKDNPLIRLRVSYNSSKKIIKDNSNCEYFSGIKDKKISESLGKYNQVGISNWNLNYRDSNDKNWDYVGSINSKSYDYILSLNDRISKIYKPLDSNQKTKITKSEPSQTQKVAEKDKIKLILCKDNEKKSRYYPFLKDEWIDGKCPKSTPVKISYDEYKLSKQTICLREKQGNDTPAYLILSKNDVSCDVGIDHTVEIKFDGEDFYLKKNKLTKQLKIAKIDTRQNQKVAKSETTVKLVFKGQYVCLEGDTNCGKYSPSGPISFNKWKSRKSSFNKNGLCMSPEFGTVFYLHTIDNCDHYEKTYSTKYYKLTNLKDNVFKIDGYIGKVAIKKFDDPTGQGEGSSVVAKIDDYICIYTDPKFSTDFIVKFVYSGKAFDKKCQKKYYKLKDNIVYKKLISNSKFYKTSNFSSRHEQWKIINKNNFNNLIQTQIAKAEPSQTQKAYQAQSHLIKSDTWVYFINLSTLGSGGNNVGSNSLVPLSFQASKLDASYFLNNQKNMKNYKFDNNDNLFKFQRKIGGNFKEFIRISEKLNNLLLSEPTKGNVTNAIKINSIIENYKPKILKDLIDEYTENNELKKGLLAYFDQEKQILTPKKKVKVAKVEEPKQEEFKPKKTNQDNEAPVITIAEAITVNDTSYILEGRVTDKADKIFVEIDGQPVRVKKGKFKVKRYSPVDEQIKIVAIDQWGNKSKTKLVNITVDIDETIVANKLEPLNPSNISNKTSNNKVALIIGIENYTEAPKANYANLDAKYFFDYARRAFGVKKQNINLLLNEEATVVKTDKAVSLWLKSKIKKNRSDLIIFFAGHGLASSDGKELYLLPQDGNPDRLERTALSRTDLFKEIISLNPKSVTMFLDTCYSGVSRDEQMLLASARPIRIVADEQEGIPDNFTIFSASRLDQISSGLKEANHGIFSYYLMKGMEGNADTNKDNDITNGELLAYMDENISQKAAEQGREQNPSLAGNPDKILMSYR